MLIPNVFQKHSINSKGVIHIGAHKCEENVIYSQANIPSENVVWIEGHPTYASEAKASFPNFTIINACISDKEESVEFIETNNRESSSILELKHHKNEHPWVVEVNRFKVDTTTFQKVAMSYNLDLSKYDFLNMDIQGAELKALKGMGDLLKNFKYIYLEVNTKELYAGCALLPEIVDYLNEYGFHQVDIHMTQHGWGDALFVARTQ
jgi:FkbM family methyltransferase